MASPQHSSRGRTVADDDLFTKKTWPKKWTIKDLNKRLRVKERKCKDIQKYTIKALRKIFKVNLKDISFRGKDKARDEKKEIVVTDVRNHFADIFAGSYLRKPLPQN